MKNQTKSRQKQKEISSALWRELPQEKSENIVGGVDPNAETVIFIRVIKYDASTGATTVILIPLY